MASKQRNAGDNAAPDSIEALEAANGSGTKVGGFVRAKKTEPKVRHPDAKDGDDQDGETEAAAANPDEIEISDDSDDDDNNKNGDEEDEDEDVDNVKKKTIPDAVFGSALAEKVHEEQEEEEQKLGAKERFKRMKQM